MKIVLPEETAAIANVNEKHERGGNLFHPRFFLIGDIVLFPLLWKNAVGSIFQSVRVFLHLHHFFCFAKHSLSSLTFLRSFNWSCQWAMDDMVVAKATLQFYRFEYASL